LQAHSMRSVRLQAQTSDIHITLYCVTGKRSLQPTTTKHDKFVIVKFATSCENFMCVCVKTRNLWQKWINVLLLNG
jgi:hypothetical protein